MNAVPLRPDNRRLDAAFGFDPGVIADAARLAAEICEVPAALIALVADGGVRVVAAEGFDRAVEVPESAIERVAGRPGGVLVVTDASVEPEAFPISGMLATGDAIRFLGAVALEDAADVPLGMAVVAGREPGTLPADRAEALRALTRLVSAHLELRATVGRLEHAAAERRRYEQHLEEYQLRLERNLAEILEQSITDPLTGLRNRRAFLDRLDDEILHARRGGPPVAVVLLDVDGFKPYNDRFGHPSGDRVLREIARLFGERVRSTDVVARIGGDEFALVLPATDAEGAYVLAERLRRAVEDAPWREHPVTVSAGAAAGGGEADAEELLAAADRALYAAKAWGRNCTRLDG